MKANEAWSKNKLIKSLGLDNKLDPNCASLKKHI